VAVHRADPARPYKALASALLAALVVLLAEGQDVLPPWAMLLLAAMVAGLGTFVVPNPVARP
jgi:hypothetical protein